MQRRKTTFKTYWSRTASTRLRKSAALICAALFCCAAAPATIPLQSPSLQTVLSQRLAALKAMHVHTVTSLEVLGDIEGAGLSGVFRSWTTRQAQRYDQTIGAGLQSIVHAPDGREWALDENGNVRELKGLMLQRSHTQDFIDSDHFEDSPQDDTLLGVTKLPENRTVYAISVAPPGGQPEEVDLDTTTLMIDRISYGDGDGRAVADYFDYRSYSGALVALREIDSNGDDAFNVMRTVSHVIVGRPIAASVFDVPKNSEIQEAGPVTVPLTEQDGHYFTRVTIHGKPYTFLVDTGAQAIIIDPHVARDLNLHPQGHLELTGAHRVAGLGLASLDEIHIGAATLPMHVAAVFDLHNITGRLPADGILGYPFFASAEVQFDAAAGQMTITRPGSIKSGTPIGIEVDREMIETQGRVNGVGARLVIDTGNSGELLLFAPFMKSHPNLLPPGTRTFAENYGAGGGAKALFAYVDELDLDKFRFFNRYSNVILEEQGAFADRFAAGNVGMGVLRNLVVTFDVANAEMYAVQSRAFDDGRYRPRTEDHEPVIIPH
jgi:predicted aspartyl protease